MQDSSGNGGTPPGESCGAPPGRIARRVFVMTSLMSGFTLATARGDNPPIATDSHGLEAVEITIPVVDGDLPGYAARPQGAGPFPIVLVNEEVWGVHEYIKDVCRRLAKQGYLAVAPEYYARHGDLAKMKDIQEIVGVVSRTPDDEIMADLDAAAKWAASHRGDAGRLAVIGFCRGGRNTWLYAAHNPRLKAAIAWYGPLGGTPTAIQPRTAMDVAGQIKCPLLGLYGGLDQGIPAELVHMAEQRAKAAGKTVEIVIYPDAPHGFHADYRPSYRRADAEDGWKKMLEWLKKYDVA
jgi:carboxymethylenebutenolidase